MNAAIAIKATERLWDVRSKTANAILIVAGSLLMAALAQVALPLPFTPVPITGQTLGVLLVGAALGSRRAAASLTLYLIEGASGLPFFALGKAGPAVLVGPTAGYLISFPVAAYVVGLLCERGLDRKLTTAFVSFLAGHAIVFASGVAWLSVYVGTEIALTMGLWPFLPGAAVKVAIASLVLPRAWHLVRRVEGNADD